MSRIKKASTQVPCDDILGLFAAEKEQEKPIESAPEQRPTVSINDKFFMPSSNRAAIATYRPVAQVATATSTTVYSYSSSAIFSENENNSLKAPKKSVAISNGLVSYSKKSGSPIVKISAEDRTGIAVSLTNQAPSIPPLQCFTEIISPIFNTPIDIDCATASSSTDKSIATSISNEWSQLLQDDENTCNTSSFLSGEKLVMRIENTTHYNLQTATRRNSLIEPSTTQPSSRNVVDSAAPSLLVVPGNCSPKVSGADILTITANPWLPSSIVSMAMASDKSSLSAVGVSVEDDTGLVMLPLGMIEKLERYGNQQSTAQYCLMMYCKDLRILRFGFNPALEMRDRAYDCLMQYVFPSKISYVFSFYHRNKLVIPSSHDGWNVYDPLLEFSRLGIPNTAYRLTNANSRFGLCTTYPQLLAVPVGSSDADLVKVSNFRSRGRFPVLSWKSPDSNVALFRCAQPNAGLAIARCTEDEALLANLVGDSGVLFIYDARPKLNAVGNQIAGEIYFLNIPNIHVIRESYQKLSKLIQRPNDSTIESNWLSDLQSTDWLLHIRTILQATRMQISKMDQDKCSVVSHCSDGWDRTIQLVSLTELCLDPFYRTLRGFCILIEKEWLSYGHQFQERHGHADPIIHDQQAPIFQQWLECVYQLLRQFPSAFQFTSRLLLTISDHLSSCRFGTFLFNSIMDRQANKVTSETVSLWTYVLNHPDAAIRFTNPLYDPTTLRSRALYPSASSKSVVVWSDFWFRYLPHEIIGGCYGRSSLHSHTAVRSLDTSQCDDLHLKLLRLQTEIDTLKSENARLLSLMIVPEIDIGVSFDIPLNITKPPAGDFSQEPKNYDGFDIPCASSSDGLVNIPPSSDGLILVALPLPDVDIEKPDVLGSITDCVSLEAEVPILVCTEQSPDVPRCEAGGTSTDYTAQNEL